MKRILVTLLILLAASPAMAMRSYTGWAQSDTGDRLYQAEIRVYLAGTEGATSAIIYSDDGITPMAQPILTDYHGKYRFYVADGSYDIKNSYGGSDTWLYDVQIVDHLGRGGPSFSLTDAAFGGIPGDGMGDSGAFAIAVDSLAAAGGGTLRVPPGDFTADSQYVLDADNVTLVFEEGAKLTATTSLSGVLLVSGDNCTLRGVTIDGDDAANEGVRVSNAGGLKIEGGRIYDVGSGLASAYGIRFLTSAATSGADISGLEIDGVAGASTSRGIAFQSSGSATGALSHIKISGCTIANISPAADGDGIVFQQVAAAGEYEWEFDTDATVTGCRFYACAKRAVKIQNMGVTVTGCSMVATGDETPGCIGVYAGRASITGNNMRAEAGASYTYCIDLNGGATRENITIANNVMVGDSLGTITSGGAGIYVRGSVGNIGRVSITGNTFNWLYDGVRIVGNSGCPYSDLAVAANTFNNLDGDGVRVDPSTGTIANVRLAANIGSDIAGELEHIFPGVTGAEATDTAQFDVTEYGATGDGSTDDRAGIQAAIDAAEAAGGGVVFFPPGYYRIYASGLTVEASGVTLQGSGLGEENVTGFGTVISPIGGTVFGPLLAIGDSGDRVYGSGARDINFVTTGYQVNGLVAMMSCTECFIEDCRLDMHYADDDARTALLIDTDSSQASESNRIEGCYIASPTAKTGAAASYGYGILIASNGGGGNTRNVISNCKIYNGATDIGGYAVQTEDSGVGRNRFIGCAIQCTGDQGINVTGSTGADQFFGVHITGSGGAAAVKFNSFGGDCVFMGSIYSGTWTDAASDDKTSYVLDTTDDNGFLTRGLILAPRSAAPSSPVTGTIYWDSDVDSLYMYIGSYWQGFAGP